MPPDEATDQPTVNNGADLGLTTEEQAAYDSMRSQPAPTGDAGHEAELAPVEAEPAAETPLADGAAKPATDTAVSEAAAPAVDGEDEDDDPTPLVDGKPPKRVSYNKYRRLEEERKADKTALDTAVAEKNKLAENQARLDERLRLINEALQPAPAAQQDDDPEPDPEADIFGHNAWLKRQLVKTQEMLTGRLEQIETGQQASIAEKQLAETYVEDAQRFSAKEPNFGPAYSYLMQVRMAQLASFHFGKDLTDPATPALTAQELSKIKSEVAREERQLVSTAIKNNKSPAAEVFRMAKMTGYRPAAAPVDPAQNGAAPANGAAGGAPAAAAAPSNGAAKPSVKSEIDRIKTAQSASVSLSHGGGSPAPTLDAHKLANMPEEEFGALLDQMSRGELRRIMGGA